jgi:hypothetical protein
MARQSSNRRLLARGYTPRAVMLETLDLRASAAFTPRAPPAETPSSSRHELFLMHVDPAQPQSHETHDGFEILLHVHARDPSRVGDGLIAR